MVYILFSWYLLYGFLKGSLFEQMKLAVLEKGDGFIIRARTGEALNIGENTCISKWQY